MHNATVPGFTASACATNEERGYSGELEAGMMLCVEAYIGEVGGPDGIKLEDQLLVTEDGVENMVACPFDPLLMG